jgi:hypothetical protein
MLILHMLNQMQGHTRWYDTMDFVENVLQENVGLEEDGFEDDRIPNLFKNLYDAEDHVDG